MTLDYEKSKNLMLFGDSKSFAAATSCNVNLTANTTEVTNKDTDAHSSDYEVTSVSGTVHTENMFVKTKTAGLTPAAVLARFGKGKKMPFVFANVDNSDGEVTEGGWKVPTNALLSGTCIFTNVQITATNKEYAQMTVDATITGTITYPEDDTAANG